MVNYTLGKSTGSGSSTLRWEIDGVSVSTGSMINLTYKTIYVTIWNDYENLKEVKDRIEDQNTLWLKRFIIHNLPAIIFEELLDETLMDGFKRGQRAKLDEMRDVLGF